VARTYAVPGTPEEYASALYEATSGVDVDTAERFRDAYVAKMLADGSLQDQLDEQVQAGIARWLKANPRDGADPKAMTAQVLAQPPGSGQRAALYNKRAPGAPLDKVFTGEFAAAELFAAVATRGTGFSAGYLAGSDAKLAKVTDIMNAYGSEVPADGGFLVPENLRSYILQMAIEYAIVRPRARIIPMDSLRVPIPMVDDTSHASSILGGVIGYWTEESTAITASQGSFGRVVLDAKKLAVYAEVPNELIQDAPTFLEWINQAFPLAIAFFEDVGFLTGTGVAEPLGVLNCPASVSVAAATGQTTQTIVWENIVTMWSRLLPQSQKRACWILNVDTFPQIATMAISVGTGGNAVWIGGYSPDYTGANLPPVTILGAPVYWTEKTPALGTTGDIILADLSYYLLGDRMTLQISQSPHFKFSSDLLALRAIERCDGRPWLQSAPLRPGKIPLTPFRRSSSSRAGDLR
jgi:HK97 family phage major capsid protein